MNTTQSNPERPVISRITRLTPIFALVCVALVQAEPQTAVADRLQLEQIFDLQWAADPRIAPDGKHVVFVRSGYDVLNDEERHSLWQVGADGGGLRR